MTPPNPFTNLHVLYLEDEPLIAFDTADSLSELGFTNVKSVYKLKAAERAAEASRFDLAVLDINVDRKQTSLELGKALLDQGTRVVFASGNSYDAKRLRADGSLFLDKPFSQQQLRTVLEEALAARA